MEKCYILFAITGSYADYEQEIISCSLDKEKMKNLQTSHINSLVLRKQKKSEYDDFVAKFRHDTRPRIEFPVRPKLISLNGLKKGEAREEIKKQNKLMMATYEEAVKIANKPFHDWLEKKNKREMTWIKENSMDENDQHRDLDIVYEVHEAPLI